MNHESKELHMSAPSFEGNKVRNLFIFITKSEIWYIRIIVEF